LSAKKKDQGNAAFKEGDNATAAQAYKAGADTLKDTRGFTPEQLAAASPLRVALLSNLAAAALKLNDHNEAMEACLAALDIQEDNVKVVYRLAQAHLGMSEYDEAKKTAQRGLEIAPEGDTTFASLLTVIQSKRAAYMKKQKATYSKMFS